MSNLFIEYFLRRRCVNAFLTVFSQLLCVTFSPEETKIDECICAFFRRARCKRSMSVFVKASYKLPQQSDAQKDANIIYRPMAICLVPAHRWSPAIFFAWSSSSTRDVFFVVCCLESQQDVT